MRKIPFLLFIVCSVLAYGSPVTPQEALERISKGRQLKSCQNVAERGYELADVCKDEAGANTLYLFTASRGFLIASADDAAPAVLGYGDTSLYDSNGNMPDGLKYWLDLLSRDVAAAVNKGIRLSSPRSAGAAIEPLCATRWGQDDPYNMECPTYNGSLCRTGCVATAMAQVMKYHKWPAQGKGELTYYSGKIEKEIYTDFTQYTLDWDNMIDDYSDGAATEIQKQTVAHLMRGVGGSAQIDYGVKASGGDNIAAGNALLKYWSYSDDMRLARRGWFTLEEWHDMLYASLRDYGPVFYVGMSFYSAHAFVCDGYDGESMFHFNWGWNGTADGYFLIDALNPYGNWETGYNGSQSALLNIHPRTDDNPGTRDYLTWNEFYSANPAADYGSGGEITVLHPGDSFRLKGSCTNYGPFDIPAGSRFATMFTPLYGGEPIATNIVELDSPLGVYLSFDSNKKTVPSGLVDGLYALNNAFSVESGRWINSFSIPGPPKYLALVTDGGNDVAFIESLDMAEAVDVECPGAIDIDELSFKVTATVKNRLPYDQSMYIRVELVKDGKVAAYSSPMFIEPAMEEREPVEFDINSLETGDDSALAAGEYQMFISSRNSYGNVWVPVCKGMPLSLTDKAGILDMAADEADGETVFYDLNGRRVAADDENALPRGVFVKKHGGAVRKIVR